MSEAAVLPQSLSVPEPTPPTLPEAYTEPASDVTLERTREALEGHGFRVVVVDGPAAAVAAVLDRVPKGAEILLQSSKTLDAIGLSAALEADGGFELLRPKILAAVKEGRAADQRRLGAAPQVSVGSVHALTEHGEALIASASGSQLAPYVFGAEQVIWVVGAQKIVPNLDAAFRRLEHHVVPLEDARARAAYGMGTALAKILIVRQELRPDRTTVVLVREPLGF